MSRRSRRMGVGAGVLAGCLVAGACRDDAAQHEPATEASAAASKAAVGQPAPDFAVSDEAGNEVRLSDHRGKRPVMLAFYPKDFTSG